MEKSEPNKQVLKLGTWIDVSDVGKGRPFCSGVFIYKFYIWNF